MTIFTRAFWHYAGERAIKTFAQSLIGGLTATGVMGILDVAWIAVLSSAALATVVYVLTSVVAVKPATPEPLA